MDNMEVKEDIRKVLEKHKIDTTNFDLAFKDFMKYFGGDMIDPREERILEKIKGYTDIGAIPKEVIEMKDLIPNIRATIAGRLKNLGYEYNDVYDNVIKELESYVLSTMVNDIVKSKNHKSLYYDYRTAVKPKSFNYDMFKINGTFERIIEKDNTGQIKKTIKNLISGSDGKLFFGSPVDFVENITRFSKICKVEFSEKCSMENRNEEGTVITTERFSKPSVYNENPILLIRKVTEYILNDNEYIPSKQFFELILVGEEKK